jgi:hypothetical protein
MSGELWFFVIFGIGLSHLAAWVVGFKTGTSSGRQAGVTEEIARLRAQLARTTVDEDGRLVAEWTDNRERGEVITEIPHSRSRATSRDLAQRILEGQGEEGALVAERVLARYKVREERVS